MLSRVAASFYWVCRYIERAENYARFIEVNLNMAPDLPPGIPEQWEPLVLTTGDQDLFKERYGEATRENVIRFLTFDLENPNSIFACLSRARENARTIRELISSEMWQQINAMYLELEGASPGRSQEALAEFYRSVRTGSHLFIGIMDATFAHGEAFHFGVLGRGLERADKTGRIVDMKYFYLLPTPGHVGTPLDLLQWSSLLKSASAYEMYRKVHGKLEVRPMVSFLLLNRLFPRSVFRSLQIARGAVRAINQREAAPGERELGRLCAELEYADVAEIFEMGLHEYADSLQTRINKVGDEIYSTYFALKDAPA